MIEYVGLSDRLYTLLAFKPNSGATVFLFWATILEADGPEELGFERGVLLSAFGNQKIKVKERYLHLNTLKVQVACNELILHDLPCESYQEIER